MNVLSIQILSLIGLSNQRALSRISRVPEENSKKISLLMIDSKKRSTNRKRRSVQELELEPDMRVATSIYRCMAFYTNRNIHRIKPNLFSTKSSMDNMQPPESKIEDVFCRLRDDNEIFLLDGGTGEELFRRKVPDDRKIWSATALVHSQYHGILEDVHTSFLQSGSNAITTNSYGVVPGVGFKPQEISEYIRESGKIARSAVKKHKDRSKSPAFVLGSMGPLIESYRADMILPHDEGVKGYELAYQSLAPFVDAFLAETMSCVDESIQVLDAVARSAETTKRPFVLISYSVDSEGNFRDGEKLMDGMQRILEEAKEKRDKVQVLAILFNCSEPEVISQALERINNDTNLMNELKSSQVLLGAYANTLTPIDPNWTLAESDTAQPLRNDLNEERYWKDFVEVWVNKFGVRIVGGCCGITPEHIQYIRQKLDSR